MWGFSSCLYRRTATATKVLVAFLVRAVASDCAIELQKIGTSYLLCTRDSPCLGLQSSFINKRITATHTKIDLDHLHIHIELHLRIIVTGYVHDGASQSAPLLLSSSAPTSSSSYLSHRMNHSSYLRSLLSVLRYCRTIGRSFEASISD